MLAVLVNASSSSAETKLALTETVAPERFAESGSVAVTPLSPAVGPAPSVYERAVAVVVTVGAVLTPVIAMFLVAAFESREPSLTLNSTVFGLDGLSFVVRYWIERSAVW